MSAFLCDDITINRIVSFLLDDAWGADEFNAPLREIGINLRHDTFRQGKPVRPCQQLACAMRMLNLYALKCRYGGRISETRNPPALDFHLLPPPLSKSDFHYVLGCFNYQCLEGDTPDKPLSKALNEIQQLSEPYNPDFVGSSAELWR